MPARFCEVSEVDHKFPLFPVNSLSILSATTSLYQRKSCHLTASSQLWFLSLRIYSFNKCLLNSYYMENVLLLSPFSRVRLCATLALGFSRQEHWNGLPFPSPVHESEAAQSCPTLRDPMDGSLPGSSIHGIFQARVLEWGAIAFSDVVLEVCVLLVLLFCSAYSNFCLCAAFHLIWTG